MMWEQRFRLLEWRRGLAEPFGDSPEGGHWEKWIENVAGINQWLSEKGFPAVHFLWAVRNLEVNA